jgi:Fic family protein
MEAFSANLCDEPEPAVRAILGHFVFVYLHPFADGNGRIGRFLMNVMLASGGYPWTIMRVTRRAEYMAALERASLHRDIGLFPEFVAQEMAVEWITR